MKTRCDEGYGVKALGSCRWPVVPWYLRVVEQREPLSQEVGAGRRAEPMTQPTTAPQAHAQFTVPTKHPMVMVLGSGDSLLRVIEKAFPSTDIHVRGNEVSATGDP